MPATVHETEPMMEMKTAPLIDVMLVLLIMFIITIPLQTHAVKLDRPVGRSPAVEINPVKNKLVITSDARILWNGTPVNRVELRHALLATQQMEIPPELQLQPEPTARYEIVDEFWWGPRKRAFPEWASSVTTATRVSKTALF